MRTVRWVYNPDTKLMGSTVEMPADEARNLVREGRVVYVDTTATGAGTAVSDASVPARAVEQAAVPGGDEAMPATCSPDAEQAADDAPAQDVAEPPARKGRRASLDAAPTE